MICKNCNGWSSVFNCVSPETGLCENCVKLISEKRDE